MAAILAMTLLQIYCFVCSDLIFKIGQHPAKLRVRKLTAKAKCAC